MNRSDIYRLARERMGRMALSAKKNSRSRVGGGGRKREGGKKVHRGLAADEYRIVEHGVRRPSDVPCDAPMYMTHGDEIARARLS